MSFRNLNTFFRKFIITSLILIFGILSILFILKFVSAGNNNFVNCDFKRTLGIRMHGLDVFCLQVLLYKDGFLRDILKNPAYYDLNTKKAVIEWQIKNKIFPATGIFGTSSIALYNTKYKNYSFSDAANLTTKKKKLIDLPEIKDEEIKISPDGYSNIGEYLNFYFTKIDFAPDVKDDPNLVQYAWSFLEDIQKTKEIPNFSSYLYIKDFLDGKTNNADDLTKKLLFLKKLREIEIKELKKIKVAANLKDVHKKIIMSNDLEIFIIDKFFEYQKGRISKDDLINILKEYENLKNELSNEILEIILKSNKTISGNFLFLSSILNKLFFVNEAEAIVGIPFGGKIITVAPCTCPGSLGWVIIVGPPRPATIFVPIVFLSSPFNYLWKQIIRPGVWTLGLYTVPSPPCLVFAGKAGCVPGPVQPQGLIFISGTSLQ